MTREGASQRWQIRLPEDIKIFGDDAIGKENFAHEKVMARLLEGSTSYMLL